jgi:hypothetical protein
MAALPPLGGSGNGAALPSLAGFTAVPLQRHATGMHINDDALASKPTSPPTTSALNGAFKNDNPPIAGSSSPPPPTPALPPPPFDVVWAATQQGITKHVIWLVHC